jgi:hypothetical protein
MGRFVRGDVVVTPFPYSDLSDSKKRPALVAAALKGDDVILCQITSRREDMSDISQVLRVADILWVRIDLQNPNRLVSGTTGGKVFV